MRYKPLTLGLLLPLTLVVWFHSISFCFEDQEILLRLATIIPYKEFRLLGTKEEWITFDPLTQEVLFEMPEIGAFGYIINEKSRCSAM